MAGSFTAMETPHLLCRSINHPWQVIATEVFTEKRKQLIVIVMDCTRCETGRVDTYTVQGELVRRRYSYIPGYQVDDRPSWGKPRVFNQNVRKETIRRLKEGVK